MIRKSTGPISQQLDTLRELLSELEAPATSGQGVDCAGAVRRAVEALHAAEDELAAARRKDEVLVMLAHELRTPLAAISNATHVLDRISSQTSRTADLRNMILRQTQHLARLVDDLLQVSRIVHGEVELHREPVSVQTVVTNAIEAVRSLVEAAGVRLELELPDEALWLEADPERLEPVVASLVSNAIKYTPAEGQIAVAAVREGDDVVFRIADTGAGIAPELLPQVFDLYTPPERRNDRAAGATGIGLTWARRLVELHGGTLKVFSEGIGKGSRFEIRLPALTSGAVQRPRVLPASDRPIGPLNLLIVEDNPDTARSLAMLLRLKGCEVVVTGDGPAALEAARLDPPNVVLLDIGLPGMDGYEVARQLQARPELQRTQFVALTGFGQAEDRRRSREEGFAFHLVKPVDPDILHQLLRNAAARLARATGDGRK